MAKASILTHIQHTRFFGIVVVSATARARAAVLRVAPFVGLLYSVLVIWFAEGSWKSNLATPPLRPWYPHKRDHSFSDIQPADDARRKGERRVRCSGAFTITAAYCNALYGEMMRLFPLRNNGLTARVTQT